MSRRTALRESTLKKFDEDIIDLRNSLSTALQALQPRDDCIKRTALLSLLKKYKKSRFGYLSWDGVVGKEKTCRPAELNSEHTFRLTLKY